MRIYYICLSFYSNVFYLEGFNKRTKRNTQVQRLSIINRITRTLRMSLTIHKYLGLRFIRVKLMVSLLD